jgi:formylglycine-generating enzyme required for sulfatase activity
MLGNVWEVCRDALGFYTNPPRSGDGVREQAFEGRSYRGGSALNEPEELRSANRNWMHRTDRGNYLGLRPMRAIR